MSLDNDLHYAAGLFDGEGSITLRRRPGLATKGLSVSMSNTDIGLLHFMSEMFGGGVYAIGKRSDRQKPIFQWVTHGIRSVEVLRRLRPLLKDQRKKARAEIVVGELSLLLGRGYDPVSRAKRISVEARILAI